MFTKLNSFFEFLFVPLVIIPYIMLLVIAYQLLHLFLSKLASHYDFMVIDIIPSNVIINQLLLLLDK
jgi:hypothetical protein